MSDELPAAAVNAGADALYELDWVTREAKGKDWQDEAAVARAVLVAATERIKCPDYRHGDMTGLVGISPPESCALCRGSGFLYVLKQETP